MAKELFVSNSIKDYSDEQQKAGVYAAVDFFLAGDFGELNKLPRYKMQAIQKSFDKCAETAIGIYRVKGIAGAIMVIFDNRFSKAMKESCNYKNDSLIIIKESEFPYTSGDPLQELADTFTAQEQERKRHLH